MKKLNTKPFIYSGQIDEYANKAELYPKTVAEQDAKAKESVGQESRLQRISDNNPPIFKRRKSSKIYKTFKKHPKNYGEY